MLVNDSTTSSNFATNPTLRRLSQWVCNIRVRDITDVVLVVSGLAIINVVAHFTSLSSMFATIPLSIIAMVLVSKWRGMTLTDLGFGFGTRRKGVYYGVGAAALVTIVVSIAIAIPESRGFFFNEHYSSLRRALFAALVVIPFQTVVPEELAFRGLLHGKLFKLGGTRAVFTGGSILFGLWHVSSSLNLTATNRGLSHVLGSGSFAQWAGVGLAVLATSGAGLIFTWLRYHTNSVLAPTGPSMPWVR